MGTDNMDSSEEDSEELEFRMYSMLHYADHNADGLPTITEIPEYSTNKYKKINTPKETPKTTTKTNEVREPENEKTQDKIPKTSGDDVILIENTHSQNAEITKDASINKKRKYNEICKKTPKKHKKLIVKSLKNNPEIVNIESSDDDQSIIEVELPDPQMPICINSSDDESTEAKSTPNKIRIPEKPSVSPVPSNMSDDFIRADCSNLNISAESNNSYAFNFGLHGVDLGDIQNFTKNNTKPDNSNGFFATPNITSKKKKNNNKNYTVPEQNYVLPSLDVYESESSDFPDSVLDVPITNPFMKPETISNEERVINTDSLIMANVINADENVGSEENTNEISQFIVLDETGYEEEPPSFTSINDSGINMSGKLYSVQQCLKDMDFYYNQNWGADFDHIKLKKEMPRDKSLWKINSNDLYRKPDRRNLRVCGFCNKKGHRDEFCTYKPIVCIYCGVTGHKQFKCPKKLCLNCGSPSNFISNHCKNCDQYKRMQCDICKEPGHSKKNCPDQWRRYHQTIKNEVPLNEMKERQKSKNTLYCSGCATKGHIINDCNNFKKFSEFRPSVPFICDYSPVYTPEGVKSSTTKASTPSRSNTPDKNKALSKSPVTQHNENDTDITKLVTELNKNSNNNNEQSSFENLRFTIKNDRVQEGTSETQSTSVVADDNYAPAIKKNKTLPNEEDENVIDHLLSSKLFHKLNTIMGRIFILDLANKMSVKYFVRREKKGGVLTLSGDTDNQEKFLAKLKELLNGKIILDEKLPFLLEGNILPKNRVALIQRLTNDIILLNNNLGRPGKVFRKVSRLSQQLRNKFPDRTFDSLDERSKARFLDLSTYCKYLNMIMLGQMGKKKGHVHLRKLDENLNVLHDSTFDIVPFHQMKDIEKNYFPIFSSHSLYDYEKMLYKTNKEIVGRFLHERKPTVERIHSTPLKFKGSSAKVTNKQLRALFSETKNRFRSLPEPECDSKIKNVYRLLLQNYTLLKKNKVESLKPLIVTQCNTILAKWNRTQS